MTWNYRIVKYRDGSGFGLHEVHYDNSGKPWSMTETPVRFRCDSDEGPKGIRWGLSSAQADASVHPVLDEPEEWPGKAP